MKQRFKKATYRSLINLQLLFLLTVSSVTAQQFDFVPNSTGKSYTESFNATEINYMGKYLAHLLENSEYIMRNSANVVSMASSVVPILGKPLMEPSLGISMGMGDMVGSYWAIGKENANPEWDKPGLHIYDGGHGMLDLCAFAAAPVNRLFKLDTSSFWQSTDIMIKYAGLRYIGFDDVRVQNTDLGFMLRKQILNEKKILGRFIKLSGINISTGINFTAITGREDVSGSAFYNQLDTPEPHVETVVDENDSAIVAVGGPADTYFEGYVHYQYIEWTNLFLQTGIQTYLNIFKFLDTFAGLNLLTAPINNTYIAGYTDVNVWIRDNTGLDNNYDGRITFDGEFAGSLFIPLATFGIQLNFGPVKLPIMITRPFTNVHRATSIALLYEL